MKQSATTGRPAPAGAAATRAASPAASMATRSEAPFIEPVGPAGDAFEREADRIANAVVRGDRVGTMGTGWSAASAPAGAIQRKCAECEKEEDEKIRRVAKASGGAAPVAEAPGADAGAAASPAVASEAATAAEAGAVETTPEMAATAAVPGLVVEDDSEAARGQMRKSEFMAALRADVCATVDAALSATGRDSQGCPWIDYWVGYYESRGSSQIERALLRYAPEAAGVATAQDYIRVVTARVQTSAETFAATGEIIGVPEGVPAMPGGGVLNSVGGMFFKARPGGPRRASAVSIRDELGGGQSLPGGVRSRMESAFGADFGSVRLHSDATGNQLSERLNARAFTVGHHVAFGPGEFRPGTIAGDALIAHELAHVVQQGGASSAAPMGKGAESAGPLEADADRAAIAAVSALWTRGTGGLAAVAGNVMPSIRSGLQISRCSKQKTAEELSVTIRPVQIANDDGTAKTALPSFDAAKRIWKKCCIALTVSGGTTVNETDYKELDESPNATPTAEETALFGAAGAAAGSISVYVADTFAQGGTTGKDISGGGGTYDGGAASPNIVVVEGIDSTVVAHEIGHAMGRLVHGPAGTVMQPSGAHNKAVDEKVNDEICTSVRGFTSATPSGKTECTLSN